MCVFCVNDVYSCTMSGHQSQWWLTEEDWRVAVRDEEVQGGVLETRESH